MPMRTTRLRFPVLSLVSVVAAGTVFACGGSSADLADGAGGGNPGAGGGVPGAGGSVLPSVGGNGPGVGGGTLGSGGVSSGGGPATGGAAAGGNGAGGDGVGGVPAAGGGPSDGGGPGTGGSGNAVGGEWGEVENPSAGCTVGPMPSVGSLMANAKLPDPFKKMDGQRITTKEEWRCRREEILQQMYAFIWGDKPVPPDGATTGTVSNSSISVSVTDGTGSTQFNVSVNMNGATAPAPAIIYYDGGFGSPTPIPSGVASIKFSAIEQSGGDPKVAKKGPFYDVYGGLHPAGFLTAQAWQISRILDVLEQHPDVIDPKRVGVTGCSRNGKGAFVGGALDNRIALTIPVESGLGGTVGLRLVEVLGGSEWPYHGISYVRWMSEVALGQFTTENNAGADNTAKLPVDMHEMMALIAPRGLYIVDNPSISNLDPQPAWVTANVGKMAFEALGVGDHMAYQGAGGDHCSWRTQYTPSLNAMIDKFLKGNASAQTGNVATDLGNRADPAAQIEWDVPTLSGEL